MSSTPDNKAIAVVTGAGIVAVIISFLRERQRRKAMPPGSYGWPLIGEMVEYLRDPPEFIRKRLKKHGGTFKTHVLLQPLVYVKPTAANISKVYGTRDLGFPEHFKDVLGRTSLVMVNDPLHKRMRVVNGRAFTSAQLDSYLAIFAAASKEHLSRWAKDEYVRDVRPDIKLYTIDIAQKILLGEDMSDSLTKRCGELFDLAVAGLESMFPYNVPGSFWSKTQRARRELVSIYQQIIDRKREAANNGALKRLSMIDMVMSAEEKDGLAHTDVELQDFCFTMIFAGHDTTLATAQGCLHYLKAIEGVEDELRAEVDQNWDGKEPVTRAMLVRFPKCRAFIMEVLRACPPVAQVMRQVRADTVIDGYLVPAGTRVALGSAAVPDEFYGLEDSSTFRLSRHLNEKGEFLDRLYETSSFASFGGGSRRCIGYKFALDEILVFLLTLLHGFEFHVAPSPYLQPYPIRTWRVKASFSTRKMTSGRLGGA